MTHDEYYQLPKWQRDELLADELFRQDQIERIIDSVRKSKNAYGVNAVLLLQSMIM